MLEQGDALFRNVARRHFLVPLSPCPFMVGTLPEKDLFGQRDVPWDISFSLR